MTYSAFIKIKDHSTVNPLWKGNEIVVLATDPLSLNSSNITVSSPKTFQDPVISDTYANFYNNRKSNISYSGFNNHTFTITAWYNSLEIVKENTDNQIAILKLDNVWYPVFTPHKLMELVINPRTIYVTDDIITPLLGAVETTTLHGSISNDFTIEPFYTSKGIPCILTAWDIKPSSSIPGEIIMNLTFTEDKEIGTD